MKITAVEPFLIRGARGYTAWTLVRVRTDEGIEGIGEGFSFGWGNSEAPAIIGRHIEQLGEQVVGTGLRRIESFADDALANAPAGAHNWASAVSAIEIALWDIAGKAAGLPVYAMLGGAARDRIPLYADHGVFKNGFSVDRILAMKDAGFEMFKWDPFRGGGNPGAEAIAECVEQVATVRDAVGPDYKLAIDAHGRFHLEGAKLAARALEPFDPIFFEDPMPLDDPAGFQELSRCTSLPLATGELAQSRDVLREFLATGALSVWQPEVGNNGGIVETMKVAAMCETFGIQVAPHNWCGPVVTRAATHVCAAVSNLLYQEWASVAPEDAWERDLIDPPPRIENGRLILPDGPGLGLTLNEDLLAQRRIG